MEKIVIDVLRGIPNTPKLYEQKITAYFQKRDESLHTE